MADNSFLSLIISGIFAIKSSGLISISDSSTEKINIKDYLLEIYGKRYQEKIFLSTKTPYGVPQTKTDFP